MSLKHLGPGSTFPEYTKGKLRLYSMVFCPYAQRARLVLAAKNIPYETVNIKLKQKPEWYLELNPLGQVPCLQLDEKRVIPESLIVSEYLDQTYPENKLIPTDPYTIAVHKLIVEEFSKIVTNFYKFLMGGDQDAAKAMLDGLERFQAKREQNYYGGSKPAFVDYMIWPWIERLEYLTKYRNLDLDRTRFAKLHDYIERMHQLPAVKTTHIPAEKFQQFFSFYLAGQDPDYDIGLN
nr:glutathione S-transferase GSTO1-1 [Brachionus angularis]